MKAPQAHHTSPIAQRRALNPSVFLAGILFLVSLGMFANRFAGAPHRVAVSVVVGDAQSSSVAAKGLSRKGAGAGGGGSDTTSAKGGGQKAAPPPAAAAAASAANNKASSSSSSTSSTKKRRQRDPSALLPEPILYIEKPTLNNAFIVEEREGNICDAGGSGSGGGPASTLPKPATKLAEGSLLPDCPPTNPNDSSAAIEAFAQQCTTRDHKSWPLLNKKVHDRINIKALKLLMTNRGCDETLEPENKPIREELWSTFANEYNNEMTILEIGSGCGHTLEWLTTYFSGPNATTGLLAMRLAEVEGGSATPRRRHPRFNILSVDGREASVRYIAETIDAKVGTYPNTSPHMMVDEKVQQPSSIKFCQADPIKDATTVGLTWSPSETFNLVFVMDQLNTIQTPDQSVCPLIKEMLRVTKVGGAVWAGHIDNKDVLRAISDCRLTDCVISPDGADDGSAGEPYGVEMTMLKESFFFGSPRFLTPKQLLEKKPIGVMWRKVPLAKK